MSRILEFRPAARAEFDDAADWYKDHESEVRDRFVAAVDSAIFAVVNSPVSFPVVSGTNIRRALVRGFPYAVFFWFDDQHIVIISVFHTSRNPIIWRGRT